MINAFQFEFEFSAVISTGELFYMFSILYFQELYLYDSAGKELFSEIVQKYVSLSHKIELCSVLKMLFNC